MEAAKSELAAWEFGMELNVGGQIPLVGRVVLEQLTKPWDMETAESKELGWIMLEQLLKSWESRVIVDTEVELVAGLSSWTAFVLRLSAVQG